MGIIIAQFDVFLTFHSYFCCQGAWLCMVVLQDKTRMSRNKNLDLQPEVQDTAVSPRHCVMYRRFTDECLHFDPPSPPLLAHHELTGGFFGRLRVWHSSWHLAMLSHSVCWLRWHDPFCFVGSVVPIHFIGQGAVEVSCIF